MEELRQTVIKLKENVKKMMVTEEAMKDVINCYTKNVEALKTYTLEINARVGVIEDTLKNDKASFDGLIKEKVEGVREDLASLDEKIDTIEEKLEEDLENTEARMDKNISNSIEKQTQERKKLEELMKENENKLKEVEFNLQKQKEIVKNGESSFKCDECEKSFVNKNERKRHINLQHPKQITCEFCESIFSLSWQYEMHLETHSKSKDKKCEVCKKEFYLEWRFKQHMNVHENPNIMNCHYFNNNKMCPYEPVGCKFKHAKSKQCANANICERKLCSQQHLVI